MGIKNRGKFMKIDNKKINKLLIGSNAIFIILLLIIISINNKNYMNYITTDKNLATTKSELNKKINTKESDKIEQINEVSIQFLNAFFNYDALNKDKIYDNIKPYSTPSLVNKLKPVEENELESDVDYKISIQNIRVYSKAIQDDSNVSVLVLADQGMLINGVDSTTPILIELKLKNIDNKWAVDDLLINKPLQNIPFFD